MLKLWKYIGKNVKNRKNIKNHLFKFFFFKLYTLFIYVVYLIIRENVEAKFSSLNPFESVEASSASFLLLGPFAYFLPINSFPMHPPPIPLISQHGQHISVTQNGLQNLVTCVTYSTCSVNSISLQGRMTSVFKFAEKVPEFKAKLEFMRAMRELWDF